jgi:probable HAF family extracellular repeat protein
LGNASKTRSTRVRFLVPAFSSLACLLMVTPYASADAISSGYQVTDLGAYPGPYQGAAWTGSSPSGVIIGSLPYTNGDRQPPTQPAAWINGQLTMLAAPNIMGYSQAVNASGQIVGTISDYRSFSGTTSNSRSFVYSNGQLTDLGNFGYASSGNVRISDNGLIAAGVVASDGSSHVIIDSSGKITEIPQPVAGVGQMEPTAINNAGQLIGRYDSSTSNSLGFLYSGGKTITLGALQGSNGLFTNWPIAVSSNGIVVGLASTPNSTQAAPSYIYQNGVMSSIPLYQGIVFNPTSVNSHGLVLGAAPIGVNNVSSFTQLLYNSTTGIFTPLSSLLPANSGWSLEAGISINDQGQILARASENGIDHLVELSPVGPGEVTPVPEPGTFLIFGLIAGAVAVRKRVLDHRD